MMDPASGCGPEDPDHVWSYDFVEDRTHDGRKFRMLNVIDKFTRECLAIRVSRKLKGEVFYTLREAHVIVENWRRHYNMVRPHSSLGRPPAPDVLIPASKPAPRPTLN